ncbi:MAG TPA: transglycosylase domain-containing protein, partial [Pseudomonadales bacterium]|nr:transglycosylase domain-containing protein [Pseudomonadales bacterium]
MRRFAASAFAGVVAIVACVAVWFAAEDAPTFAAVRDRWQPSDAYLLDRHGVVIDVARVDFGVRRYDWIALDALSTAFVDAIVRGEDRRFYAHDGVDWRAALSALHDNAAGKARRGASTITMQLAALLDPALAPAHRTWWQKV